MVALRAKQPIKKSSSALRERQDFLKSNAFTNTRLLTQSMYCSKYTAAGEFTQAVLCHTVKSVHVHLEAAH